MAAAMACARSRRLASVGAHPGGYGDFYGYKVARMWRFPGAARRGERASLICWSGPIGLDSAAPMRFRVGAGQLRKDRIRVQVSSPRVLQSYVTIGAEITTRAKLQCGAHARLKKSDRG
jgi:hypothetical protein